MRLDNKYAFYHIIDAHLSPHLTTLALIILKHRNEDNLLCMRSQKSLAEQMGVSQRAISEYLDQLASAGVMIPISTLNGKNKKLRGPNQYYFLSDFETQRQMVEKELDPSDLPEPVGMSFVRISKIANSPSSLEQFFDMKRILTKKKRLMRSTAQQKRRRVTAEATASGIRFTTKKHTPKRARTKKCLTKIHHT